MSLIYPKNPVQQALHNVIRTYDTRSGNQVYKLASQNVLLLKNLANTDYAILSGGGSGHEPAFAGMLCESFLNCAVAGEIFTSPSAHAVYLGIKNLIEREGKSKILVVVMNYTGDRIHFGMAIERAKAEFLAESPNLQIEMLIAEDDISLPDNIKPRGMTGTLLYIRMAKNLMKTRPEMSLTQILEYLDSLKVGTVGASISTCSNNQNGRHNFDNHMSLGLGIHGEPGFKQVSFQGVDSENKSEFMIDQILEPLNQFIDQYTSADHILVYTCSNLGGFTKIEFGNISELICQKILKRENKSYYASGDFMTSLDMKGFNISVAVLTSEQFGIFSANDSVGENPNLPNYVLVADDLAVAADENNFQNFLTRRALTYYQATSPRRRAEMMMMDFQVESPLELNVRPQIFELFQNVAQRLADLEQEINNLDRWGLFPLEP